MDERVTVMFDGGGCAVWPDDFRPRDGEVVPVVGERLGDLRVAAIVEADGD